MVLKDLLIDFEWAVRAFQHLLQKTPLLLRKLVRISIGTFRGYTRGAGMKNVKA